MVLVRELTKFFEEYLRGKISEILEYLSENQIKGECLIIVEGYQDIEENSLSLDDAIDLVHNLVANQIKPNQAIKEVAKKYHFNRQELYTAYHEKK